MNATHTGCAGTAIQLSEAEEQLCRAYGQSRVILGLLEFVVLPLVLVALTATGAAAFLVALTRTSGTPEWLGNLEFLVMVGVLCRLSLFPVQALDEFWLEQRFGLSHQSFGSWFWEWLCRSALFGAATVVLLFPVVAMLPWWPWLMIPWCLAFLPCRAWFYEFLYYPLLDRFYPVRFLRHETFELPGIGKRTLPVYEVAVSHKTRRANAAIRICGSRTAIYVTDTLIDEFTDGEERVVMAHEFGHLYDRLHLEERTPSGVAQAHRKLLLGSVQILAGCASLCVMHCLAPFFGLRGVQDLSGFPLLAALTLALASALSPWLCAEARRDECDADQYALAITGDVSNYVSVMRKLRRMNLEGGGTTPLSRWLFDTHPSFNERVHLAQQYRRRHSQRRKSNHWRGWRHIQRHGRR